MEKWLIFGKMRNIRKIWMTFQKPDMNKTKAEPTAKSNINKAGSYKALDGNKTSIFNKAGSYKVLDGNKTSISAKVKNPRITKRLLIGIATLAIIAVALTTLTSGLLAAQQPISSNGNIQTSVNIGVYSNSAATIVLSSLSWGTVTPGTTTNQTIYIKNTGNAAETLNMTTSGWSPSYASSYLTLSWNQEGSAIASGSIVSATITLSAASSTGNLTSFSFNIIITGTQQS